jgi:hypothetical protein
MGLPDKPGDKDLRQRPANSTGGVVVLTRPYQIVQLIAVVLLNYVHQSATGIGSPEKVQDPLLSTTTIQSGMLLSDYPTT